MCVVIEQGTNSWKVHGRKHSAEMEWDHEVFDKTQNRLGKCHLCAVIALNLSALSPELRK